MVQQFDLRGKTALVTGATSGIGTEVAAELAKRGAEVILGVRSVEAGKKVAAEIAARYPGAKVEVGPSLDLKSQASVRAFAEAINKRKGSLDILVNNAGLGYNKREFTEEGVGILAQVSFCRRLSSSSRQRARDATERLFSVQRSARARSLSPAHSKPIPTFAQTNPILLSS